MYGMSNQTGTVFPLRLNLIIAFHLGALPMQINGFIYFWQDTPKVCNLLTTVIIAIQLVMRLISRVIKNDEENVNEINIISSDYYETYEKDDGCRKVLESRVKSFKVVENFTLQLFSFTFMFLLTFHG